MKHFHVMVGPMSGSMMPTNVVYDEYEQSLTAYFVLARALFEGRYDDEFTIENLVENTVNSNGVYMGTTNMTVVWLPCEDEPCSPAVWN